MELEFKLTIEEANIILNALSTQPFNQVAKLIEKLNQQAQPQLTQPELTQPEKEIKSKK